MELQLDYGEIGLPVAFLFNDQVVEDPVQHKFHRLYNRSYTTYSADAFSLVKDYEAMSPRRFMYSPIYVQRSCQDWVALVAGAGEGR